MIIILCVIFTQQQSASHPVKMEEFVQGQKCVAVLRGGKDADAPYVRSLPNSLQ